MSNHLDSFVGILFSESRLLYYYSWVVFLCVCVFVLLFKRMLFFVFVFVFLHSGTLKTVNIGGPAVLYVTVQFSSVPFKMAFMRSEKPIIMRTSPSLRHVPNVAFKTVPVFVWLTAMILSRPFFSRKII